MKPPKEFDPLPPGRVVAPPGGAEEDMMRRVVRGVHQAHFTGSEGMREVEIKS